MSAIATTLQNDAVALSTDTELTTRGKLLIGGTGALAPIILNLLVVDLNTTFANISSVKVLGYLIRVAVLFLLGAAMAYFHKNEKNALRILELGIIAPALFTGVLNGTSNINDANLRAGNEPPAATAGLLDAFIPTAYAMADGQTVKTYTRPEESVASQLWQGISGARTDNVWFVVVGTYKLDELQKARELVNKISDHSSAFKPQIYKNDKYYAVVIGENLTLAQAKARKQKANEASLPSYGEIYLFNPWASE